MTLPVGWRMARLSDVATSELGKMLDRGKVRGHDQVRYLRNVNVQWGRIDTYDLLTMELAAVERRRFEVLPGDLLVCEGGEIGRCAIWRGDGEYLAYQKALHRIRPGSEVAAPFLRYLLEHYAWSGELAKHATGSTIAHLPQQKVRSLEVPVPPLEEQRRIVEILEDHLSRLDAARLELRRSRDTSLTALRMASLRTACSAPGTAYSIGDLATVRTGSTPLKSNRAYYEGGIVPWVTSGDLSRGLIASARSFVTELAVRERNLKVFPAGTLLVAMYGEGKTRGRCGELGIPATTNQACAAIELHDAELKEWVRLALDSQYEQMRALASGGVQPNLNLSLVRGIEVVVPDPAVRSAAIGQVRAIEHARQQLAAAIDRQLLRSERLRRALLAAAFHGRLTGHASDLDRAKELAAAET